MAKKKPDLSELKKFDDAGEAWKPQNPWVLIKQYRNGYVVDGDNIQSNGWVIQEKEGRLGELVAVKELLRSVMENMEIIWWGKHQELCLEIRIVDKNGKEVEK